MQYFEYGLQEIEYLKRRDKKLGAAIDQIGIIRREITPDPLEALLFSVVSQQISKKAALTVWQRFCALGEIAPQSPAQLELAQIQGCGMSARKARYIQGIIAAVQEGRLDFSSLKTQTDEEIIRQLSSLPGVGTWTAEMLLIFSFGRPDVLSYKDLAIRRGMRKLYDLPELSQKEFDRYRKKYSPYGSVASLYLWELSGKS